MKLFVNFVNEEEEMSNEDRLIGPPGTGKTTFLTRAISYHAQQRGSDAVVAVSHTRAAAAELAGRDVPIDTENIATLHALAYRALERPELCETKEHFETFSAEYPHWSFASTREIDDVAFGADQGDTVLSQYSLLRNMERPRELWPSEIAAFADAWEHYKRQTDTIDYTDMIDIALHNTSAAPRDPEVLIVDEAQDMTRLQWRLATQWAAAPSCDTLVTAGDPDQAIYQWAGADPRWFRENTPRRQKVLEQSYRVPRAVHALAMGWIAQVRDRVPVAYLPRDHEGACVRSEATCNTPEHLLRVIDAQLAAGRSVMIMASCAYMLMPTLDMLRRHAIPFSNPWRRKRGDWNPLYRRTETSTITALKSFLRPHTDGRLWTRKEALQWLALTARVLRRGGVKQLKSLESDDAVLTTLADIMTPEALSAALAPLPECLDWLAHNLKTTKQGPATFPMQVIKRHGTEALDKEPRVHIGTCHSFKGAEADCVIVYPDLSARGHQEWLGEGRDAVMRLFYVAFTRAKDTVVLCRPGTGMSVWT